MRNGQSKPPKKLTDEPRESRLLVADVARYLSGLARLHEDEKTGNIELSEGLKCVAQALRRYANYPALELSDAIKKNLPSARRSATALGQSASILPLELESIGQEDIGRILDGEGYTKQQLAELGFRRFGISRSKLERLPKKETLDSIRAALEHEKSLDAISMEASRGGKTGQA